MTAHHLVPAAMACLVGLAALWAGVSVRRWRLALAVGVSLAPLIIGAYEPAVSYLIAVFAVTGPLIIVRWFARRRRAAPEQQGSGGFSLRDLLFATALLAVLAAVVSQAPHPNWWRWQWRPMLGSGLAIALSTFLAAWVVYGRARWWKRIAGGLALWPVGAAVGYVASGFLRTNAPWSGPLPQFLGWPAWMRPRLQNWYMAKPYLPTWLDTTAKMALLGFVLLLATLVVARLSGWFPQRGDQLQSVRVRQASRFALSGMLLGLALLMAAVYWQLPRPVPVPPDAAATEDDAWSALCRLMHVDAQALSEPIEQRGPARPMTTAEYRARTRFISGNTPQPAPSALAKEYRSILAALELPLVSRPPYDHLRQARPDPAPQAPCTPYDPGALAANALYERLNLPPNQRTIHSTLEASRALIRLSRLQVGMSSARLYGTSSRSLGRLFPVLYEEAGPPKRFLPTTIEPLLRELVAADEGWLSFEQLASRQRVLDSYGDWWVRLRLLLDDWSGENPYKYSREAWFCDRASLRLTAIWFALDLYHAQHGEYPPKLTDLERILPARILFWPGSTEQFEYRLTNSYTCQLCSISPRPKHRHAIDMPGARLADGQRAYWHFNKLARDMSRTGVNAP